MIDLKLLTPVNLLAEKAKFFASNEYEPQFQYSQPISEAEIGDYGPPQLKFFQHAVNMLQHSSPLRNQAVPRVTPEQVTALVRDTCQAAHIPEVTVEFSPDYLSQARLDQGILYIRTPILFFEIGLKGKIHHEIESHYLRVLNNAALGLPVHPENFEFRSTEEGLANLHSYLEDPSIPMRKTFLGYAGVYLSQHLSFRAVYQELMTLGASPELAWSITTRNKRGSSDTSLPGGFTRDRTYFEGVVKVWQWLMTPGNDPHNLYLGRITLDEIEQTRKLYNNLSPQPELHFPRFIADNAAYLDIIKQIGETNQLAELIA